MSAQRVLGGERCAEAQGMNAAPRCAATLVDLKERSQGA